MISPYCHYDAAQLDQLAEAGNPWARYLRIWLFYLSGEKRQINSSAEETMSDCPQAFNLYSLMAHEGSLGIMHRVSRASMSAMYSACASGWAENAALPVSVQEAASLPPTNVSPLIGWGAASKALRKAENHADPSWQILATLLEDTAAHVAAANLYVATGGSTEQSMVPYVEAFLPALEHHPQRDYFVSRKFSLNNEPDEIAKVCQGLRFEDPNLWIDYETRFIWRTKNSRGELVGYDAFYGASRDFTASSLCTNGKRQNIDDKFKKMLLRELKGISPFSPLVLVKEINGQLSQAKEVNAEEIADWEKRASFSSTCWHQLGEFYLKRLEYEDSYRCYETSFALSPTHKTARDWAWAYEYAKELDKVVPTLERFLEEEDFGLGHSNTHYEIARFYLRHDRGEEAKPHALKAAQSWSARGLAIAGKACERLELNEEAEKWYRAISEAYPSYSGFQWYLWLNRSGGTDNMDLARKLAKQQLGAKALIECSASGWWPIAYYLMESDLDRSLKLTRLRQQEKPELFSDSFLLVIALDLDDKALIKQAVGNFNKRASKDAGPNEPWPTRYAKAIVKVMAAESAEQISLEELDQLIRDDYSDFSWCNASFFFSRLLEAREFTEHATRYRDWAITANLHDYVSWHLAKYDSQRLKVTVKTP